MEAAEAVLARINGGIGVEAVETEAGANGVLGRSQVEGGCGGGGSGGPPMAVGRNGLLAAREAEGGRVTAEAGGRGG